MRRKFAVAIAGTAIVVAGLSGCSSSKSSTGAAGPSNAKVTIDGQNQNVHGTVACNSTGGKINIAIGDQASGIGAVLGDGNPPHKITRTATGVNISDPTHPVSKSFEIDVTCR